MRSIIWQNPKYLVWFFLYLVRSIIWQNPKYLVWFFYISCGVLSGKTRNIWFGFFLYLVRSIIWQNLKYLVCFFLYLVRSIIWQNPKYLVSFLVYKPLQSLKFKATIDLKNVLTQNYCTLVRPIHLSSSYSCQIYAIVQYLKASLNLLAAI